MLIEEKGTNLGEARIEPVEPVVAGTRQTLVLYYKTGSKGLKRGGTIRITIPHGFTTPQVDEFYKDGFVTASCPDSTISLSLQSPLIRTAGDRLLKPVTTCSPNLQLLLFCRLKPLQ